MKILMFHCKGNHICKSLLLIAALIFSAVYYSAPNFFLQFKEFELYWGAVFLLFKEFELYWGAVSFFKICSHIFMIFGVKFE